MILKQFSAVVAEQISIGVAQRIWNKKMLKNEFCVGVAKISSQRPLEVTKKTDVANTISKNLA